MQKITPNALVSANPREYSDYVEEVILAYFAASLREPPQDKALQVIVAEWEAEFREVDIPASKLMKLYRLTMQKNPKFFKTGDILETWNEVRLDEVATEPKICQICKGEKRTWVMDFKTGKDVKVDCQCASFIGK